MRRLLAAGLVALAVLGAGAGLAAPAAGAGRAGAMADRAVYVVIQGRIVRFGAEFWRDLMPPGNGPLQLELSVTTADARGLPADLRGVIFRAVTASGQIWDGRLRPGEQFAHDPRSQRYEGDPGPRWPVGTLATGVFYFRDGTTTYRVPITRIPVGGAY
jgi:hypothetical protein